MIFTIGYSNRSLTEFLDELGQRGITQLVDVRSRPWSRNSAFNADQIEHWAPLAGIEYRRSGQILGGHSNRPLDAPAYVEALVELLSGAARDPLAIMCAEGDPEQCHRTWDIGASLLVRWGVVAQSIRRDGRTEDVTISLARVKRSNFGPGMAEAVGKHLRTEFL